MGLLRWTTTQIGRIPSPALIAVLTPLIGFTGTVVGSEFQRQYDARLFPEINLQRVLALEGKRTPRFSRKSPEGSLKITPQQKGEERTRNPCETHEVKGGLEQGMGHISLNYFHAGPNRNVAGITPRKHNSRGWLCDQPLPHKSIHRSIANGEYIFTGKKHQRPEARRKTEAAAVFTRPANATITDDAASDRKPNDRQAKETLENPAALRENDRV